MLKATTLVHKGAMEMAVHAVSSFATHFSSTHILHIHTDPSTDDEDHRRLLEAAAGMQAKVITARERGEKVKELLQPYPLTRDFVNRSSYFAKLELPMYEEAPYFYFDSDVIWLRHVPNLAPPNAPNAFSTETWTWYNGIAKSHLWIKEQTPRRVNSGVHYLGESFPYERMERMLQRGMFDKEMAFAGDQEIFAYLYYRMEYYHPEDIKRSRVGSIYQLASEHCAALHFPGRMWQQHMNQIEQLGGVPAREPLLVRYQPAVIITNGELLKMRLQIQLGKSRFVSKVFGGPINLMRKMRRNSR